MNVLSRPNACCFLTYGRLLWRLDLHYSEVLTSQDLVVSVLDGPTGAASLIQPDLYDDEVSQGEIKILIGTATNGSMLWPPESVFCSSDRWVGHWTIDNESWFQNHLLEISNNFASCFRTCREWLRSGFQVRCKAAQNIVGSEQYAKLVCIQHNSKFSLIPPGRLTRL